MEKIRDKEANITTYLGVQNLKWTKEKMHAFEVKTKSTKELFYFGVSDGLLHYRTNDKFQNMVYVSESGALPRFFSDEEFKMYTCSPSQFDMMANLGF